MKKKLVIMCAALLALALMLSGCGGNAESSKKADIDLTEFSSTMAYTKVNDINEYPDEYEGKTIRMNGKYYSYIVEEGGELSHTCYIEDSSACCAQELEFKLSDKSNPDDYLEEDDPITVTGTLKYNDESGFAVITDATLEKGE